MLIINKQMNIQILTKQSINFDKKLRITEVSFKHGNKILKIISFKHGNT